MGPAAFRAFGAAGLPPDGPAGLALDAHEHRQASVREGRRRAPRAHRRVRRPPAHVAPPRTAQGGGAQADRREGGGGPPAPPPPSRFYRNGATAFECGADAPFPAAAAAAGGAATAAAPKPTYAVEAGGRVVLKDKLEKETLTNLREKKLRDEKDPHRNPMREAHADLAKALATYTRVTPAVKEVIHALLPSLADAQPGNNLSGLASLGALAPAVGAPIKGLVKLAVPPLLESLGNSKKNVRDEALAALHKWVGEVSVEPMLPLLPEALAMKSPVGRATLLGWFTAYVPALPPTCLTATAAAPLLLPLVRNLDDRAHEVRAAAEAAIAALLSAGLPADLLLDTLTKFPAATVAKLRPLVAKICAPHAARARRAAGAVIEARAPAAGREASGREAARAEAAGRQGAGAEARRRRAGAGADVGAGEPPPVPRRRPPRRAPPRRRRRRFRRRTFWRRRRWRRRRWARRSPWWAR